MEHGAIKITLRLQFSKTFTEKELNRAHMFYADTQNCLFQISGILFLQKQPAGEWMESF